MVVVVERRPESARGAQGKGKWHCYFLSISIISVEPTLTVVACRDYSKKGISELIRDCFNNWRGLSRLCG